MRKLVAKAAVLTLTIAAAGTFTTAGPAAAEGHHVEHAGHKGGGGTTVSVHGNGTTVTLSRNTVREGDTSNAQGGSAITLFRLVGKATLVTFKADLHEEFTQDPSIAAQGTRDLNRDIRAFGLADLSPVTKTNPVSSESVTERLKAGTYYLMDLGNVGPGGPNPVFTTFTVRHSGRDGDDRGRSRSENQGEGGGHHSPVIKLTAADTIQSPLTLPAHGTVTVKNVSDTIHFMAISRVAAGTTDAKIQASFVAIAQGKAPTGPPPVEDSLPGGGMDVLSPGHQLDLTYDLPPGTYVLACFVADDVTGMPHAFMGMHQVVTLR